MAKKLSEKGRALRAQARANARNDATLDGVRPKKGLWLIHRERGRVYGRIIRVKRDGTVVLRALLNGIECETKHRPITLINGGYSYVEHAHQE